MDRNTFNSIKLKKKLFCPQCSNKGWVMSNNEDGLLEIQRCDYCLVFGSDTEARASIAREDSIPYGHIGNFRVHTMTTTAGDISYGIRTTTT